MSQSEEVEIKLRTDAWLEVKRKEKEEFVYRRLVRRRPGTPGYDEETLAIEYLVAIEREIIFRRKRRNTYAKTGLIERRLP
jgi:hypothetical protein